MKDIFTTERLSLEVIAERDNEFMFELVNSKGWLEFIGNRNVNSIEDAVNYINKIRNMQNLVYWVVRIKTDKTSVGIISFLKRDYLDHYDIGFAFLPEYQGNGYAYEAANAVLLHVKQYPQHAVILATTIPANTTSISLLTKLGLHFEKEIEINHDKLHVYSNEIEIPGSND